MAILTLIWTLWPMTAGSVHLYLLPLLESHTFPVHIIDLVTFDPNKYLTGEGVKIGSGIWKKVKWDLLNNPWMYFQCFVHLRKVYSQLHLIKDLATHLIVVYEGHTWWVCLVKKLMYFVNISHNPMNSDPKSTTSSRDPLLKNARNVINLFLEPKNEVYTWGK